MQCQCCGWSWCRFRNDFLSHVTFTFSTTAHMLTTVLIRSLHRAPEHVSLQTPGKSGTLSLMPHIRPHLPERPDMSSVGRSHSSAVEHVLGKYNSQKNWDLPHLTLSCSLYAYSHIYTYLLGHHWLTHIHWSIKIGRIFPRDFESWDLAPTELPKIQHSTRNHLCPCK